ncbi:MAG: hypothetical protein KAW47_07750 [Thermoplasmatales archaeon]|jgi:hypothetical protein|nr:hypothetical protein [Thermoplasmatales archaeon]
MELINKFCTGDDLKTFDPYDLWKTAGGFIVKNFYNHHPKLGLVPAALFTLYDVFLNNERRNFYTPQEYPIVRAWAALILLNLYRHNRKASTIDNVVLHLDWLKQNTCHGYSGYCWGLGFKYAVSKDLIYDSNMPLSTMTPYPLEAFVTYTEISKSDAYLDVIRSIYSFFENDIQILEETKEYLVTSYAPLPDRKVVNAVSYSMYSLAILLPYIDEMEHQRLGQKIKKLFAFIVKSQNADGSWFYSPEGHSFIDCFHSCVVLKNIIKTNRAFPLHDSDQVVAQGYLYLKNNFFVEKVGLFKRFSKSNKPSIVKFDLYDNAEMLNLAILMGDGSLVGELRKAIEKNFCVGEDIYSQIDIMGKKRNKNMLRWAVMPYLYALSLLE